MKKVIHVGVDLNGKVSVYFKKTDSIFFILEEDVEMLPDSNPVNVMFAALTLKICELEKRLEFKKEWKNLDCADWNDFNAVKAHDINYVSQWASQKLKDKNHDK